VTASECVPIREIIALGKIKRRDSAASARALEAHNGAPTARLVLRHGHVLHSRCGLLSIDLGQIVWQADISFSCCNICVTKVFSLIYVDFKPSEGVLKLLSVLIMLALQKPEL
jgi:hypothetical protein